MGGAAGVAKCFSFEISLDTMESHFDDEDGEICCDCDKASVHELASYMNNNIINIRAVFVP